MGRYLHEVLYGTSLVLSLLFIGTPFFLRYYDSSSRVDISSVPFAHLAPDATKDPQQTLGLLRSELAKQLETSSDISPLDVNQLQRLNALAAMSEMLIEHSQSMRSHWRDTSNLMMICVGLILVIIGFTWIGERAESRFFRQFAAASNVVAMRLSLRDDTQAEDLLRRIQVIRYHLRSANEQFTWIYEATTERSSWFNSAARSLHYLNRFFQRLSTKELSPERDPEGMFATEWKKVNEERQQIAQERERMTEALTAEMEARLAAELDKQRQAADKFDRDLAVLEDAKKKHTVTLGEIDAQRRELERSKQATAQREKELAMREARTLRQLDEARELKESSQKLRDEASILVNRIEAWAQTVGTEVINSLRSQQQ